MDSIQITARVSPEQVARIDKFAAENRWSRALAVRVLTEVGLEAKPVVLGGPISDAIWRYAVERNISFADACGTLAVRGLQAEGITIKGDGIMNATQTISTPVPAVQPRNGLGISSFVLGLTATVIGLIPILAIPALAAALVGFGPGPGEHRPHPPPPAGKARTILGVAFSVLGVTLAIVGLVIVANAANKLQTDLNNLNTGTAP